MRLNPRKNVNEEFVDLPSDIPNHPGYPYLPKPYSTPFDAPLSSPSNPHHNPDYPNVDPDIYPFGYHPDDFPESPELRRAREKAKRNYRKPTPPRYPPKADKDGDGRLSREEIIGYIILMAGDLGLPDDIIQILMKYLQGTAGALETLRLLGYIEQIKELLRNIRRDFDPSFFPFEIPDPDDLPYPFN